MQFPAKKKYTYGLNQGDINKKNAQFKLNLVGEFNIYNALASVCIGLSQGINLEICKKAIEKVTVIPGRMEIITEKPFKVIVDLAHTPDSYKEVFKSVKAMSHNKIISIFGSCLPGWLLITRLIVFTAW